LPGTAAAGARIRSGFACVRGACHRSTCAPPTRDGRTDGDGHAVDVARCRVRTVNAKVRCEELRVAVLCPVPAAYGVLVNYVASKLRRTSRLLGALPNSPWG
jgi:hypothetical protein